MVVAMPLFGVGGARVPESLARPQRSALMTATMTQTTTAATGSDQEGAADWVISPPRPSINVSIRASQPEHNAPLAGEMTACVGRPGG